MKGAQRTAAGPDKLASVTQMRGPQFKSSLQWRQIVLFFFSPDCFKSWVSHFTPTGYYEKDRNSKCWREFEKK